MLEILAQILVLVTLGRRLPQRWLAFIDNVAGQWALTNGYGKDPDVNGVGCLRNFANTCSTLESHAGMTCVVRHKL